MALDPLHSRLQGSLDEGPQEREPGRRQGVFPDEVPLQPHGADAGAGEFTGIPAVGKDQLSGAAADVEDQVGVSPKAMPESTPR